MKAIEAKIVVLGAQGVGKTSLVMRYISNICTKEIAPTIGASFFTCRINVDDIKVIMQVWDTAGQERFKAMAPMYYRNANAALLIFDLSTYSSFAEIKIWVQELQKNVQEPMILTLVGNKCDLNETRCVSREEAFLYASSIGGNYFETSAVSDQGVEQVFVTTALGLVQLSQDINCCSLRRYESIETINYLNETIKNSNSGHIGIGIDTNDEVNGTGRLETPSWSIDHIAHGNEQYTGWCCFY